jgi:hypothetical protein
MPDSFVFFLLCKERENHPFTTSKQHSIFLLKKIWGEGEGEGASFCYIEMFLKNILKNHPYSHKHNRFLPFTNPLPAPNPDLFTYLPSLVRL